MSDRLQWFRWHPGAIPQLERIPLASRGAAMAVLEAMWVNPDMVDWSLRDILGELLLSEMLPDGSSEFSSLNSVMPILLRYIEREILDAEAFREKKRLAGKAGGLAKASNAISMVAQTNIQTDIQTEKNTPLPPKGGGSVFGTRRKKPPQEKRKGNGLFPVDESQDEALKEAYYLAVETYPTKDAGHNHKIGAWEERRIQRDSPQAQSNFLAIVQSGKATPEELYACTWDASQEWARNSGQYQWIPNLSTFYGPEKALWLNHLTRARKALEQLAKEVKP